MANLPGVFTPRLVQISTAPVRPPLNTQAVRMSGDEMPRSIFREPVKISTPVTQHWSGK